jgi:hypothetical protein
MLVLALTAASNLYVATIDVEAAYLEADMDTDIYMSLSPDIVRLAIEVNATYIIKLRKALYGAIQVARLWNQLLTKVLEDGGCCANPYDACLYSRWTGSDVTHVAVHVDDLLIASSSKRGVNDIEKILLNKCRAISTSRHCFTYLGMNVTSFAQ